MGVNNITDAPGDGNPITNEFLQGPVSALEGDIVPRSGSGVPTEAAGALGTAVYPFSELHVGKIFVGGQEQSSTIQPGGPGSITPASTIQNGVVSGQSAAGREGVAGWIHQAGASGVTITASSTDPLVVKLDGTTYQRTSNIAGPNSLPSNFTQAVTPRVGSSGVSSTSGGTWAGRNYPPNADRARYRYGTGAQFNFHSGSTEILPDSYGPNIIIKSVESGGEITYTYCQRASSSTSTAKNVAKLKIGEAFNTSTTGQSYPAWRLPWATSHSVIRCGALFVDPLTSTWNLTISARVVGSVNTTLPGATGYAQGDMVFLESDQRWHRFSGTAWVQTSFVFLSLLAIDGGAVVAVMPARTEEALGALYDKKFAVLGDPMSREGVKDGDLIRYGGRAADVEEKGFAELGGQQFEQVGSGAVVDTSDTGAGTLSNSEMFCVYLDVAADTYHFEAVPPIYQVYRRRLLLIHPNRPRLYVGSFVTDSSGTPIAEQRLNTGSRRNELNEGNDDAFIISNPSLFGRSLMTDLGQNEDRRMQIEVRGRGVRNTGTNTYRYRWRGTSPWWPGPLVNKERWDDLFYSYLPPFALEELEYDTDNDGNLRVEFSQWSEADLLHATGLSQAARDGATAGAGAAGGAAGAQGSIDSVNAPQIAADAVGQAALGPASVGIPSFDVINPGAAAAGNALVVVADPDDATNLRLQFSGDFSGGGGGGGGGTLPDGYITYPKFNTNVIATNASILDPDTSAPRLLTDVNFEDIFAAIEAQLGEGWGDWDASQGATFANSDFTNNGAIALPALEGEDIVAVTDTTTSAKTIAFPANDQDRLFYFTNTANSSLPTLTSGTARGFLIGQDGSRRWAYPVSNPEGSDQEEAFYLDGSDWTAHPYTSDIFEPNFGSLPANTRWYLVSAKANDGPGSSINFFNDETCIARRILGEQQVLRITYSTNNNRHIFSETRRILEIPDSVVRPVNIDATNASAAGKWIKVNATDATKFEFVDAPSGGGGLTIGGTSAAGSIIRRNAANTGQDWATAGPTEITLASHTGAGLSTQTGQTLPNSRRFTDYDAFVMEFCLSTNSSVCYFTPMYLMKNFTTSYGKEIVFIRFDQSHSTNVSIDSATGYRIRHIGTAADNSATLNLKSIRGINF